MCKDKARQLRRTEHCYYQHRKRQKASDAVCTVCGTGLYVTRSTRRYCSDKCRQYAYRHRTPSAEEIRKRFDQELARLHADLESHRRQQWVLRAAKGDYAAAEKLAKLK
jgi:hypothetical protein